MEASSTRHVDARSQKGVALDVHEPEVAARTHIRACVNAGTGFREHRAELDGGGPVTVLKAPSEKRPSHILSHDARNERKRLCGTFERPIAADNRGSNDKRQDDRRGHNGRCGVCEPLQCLSHADTLDASPARGAPGRVGETSSS